MVIWTDYLVYRAELRGFDLAVLEQIMLGSTEHYYDSETGRVVVIGRYLKHLVMMPYELSNDDFVPVTVHTTTRQQINFRLKSGRYIINE